MSEQEDVITALREAGVLAGVRWAYLSASARTLEEYSEEDGHDATWLGTTRFTLFRNRLDRVFACDRYAVSSENDDAGLDTLLAQLSTVDVDTMPRLAPDLVERSDLNGSPGWASAGVRLLLASCPFGKVDEVHWSEKSPTKQRVASQPNPDAAQGSLFEGLVDEEVAGIEAMFKQAKQLDLLTFVLAHTLDPVSQNRELILGRPRLNSAGEDGWHWQHDVLSTPPADGGRRTDVGPRPTGPSPVPDAPVRIRRRNDETGHASAEQ
ncbi:hypothetical protein [Tsukamurella ocularis]|uniref:hypothetical protein n=1 Tax=Tsukamurella ocularis TaxID=1970234 RepID=UPI002169C324|nr:hypothetical protein [Tsukamurella ocularis]MCS3778482.1 hypothetical protein [Tsukamurella ocularis]MCS3789184.1 hypothetical protein [Tsukamurella ocularis]MCS3853034.1 hypothetical protein [Tsukamurella ocularis]